MYAIVATGGKQYKVFEGDTIEVEKLSAEAGESVALSVVFIADGSTIITDADKLSAAMVSAQVVEHFKGDKQLIFKFKKRKGYKRLRGHRQDLTRLEIKSIKLTGGAGKKTTSASAKAADTAAPKETAARATKPKASSASAVKAAATETKAEAKPAAKPKAKAESATDEQATAKPATTRKKPAPDKADAADSKATTEAKPAARKPAAKKTDDAETAAE
jgi:large subunit ribosomal protein L21